MSDLPISKDAAPQLGEKRPRLESERLILRPFVASDAVDVHRLAGVREIADTTLNIPHPYPLKAAEAWIGRHGESWKARKGLVFAIESRAHHELMGAIGLMEFDWRHRRAEMGYWIGVPFWGQGFATEAGRCLAVFAFEELRLNRLQATVLPRNPASSRVLEKVGMQFEGILRQFVQKDGHFDDLRLYSLIAP